MIKFLGDNLLILGGDSDGNRDLSNVEVIKVKTEGHICNPFELEYPVSGHSSVATSLGVITCGGWTTNCTLQTIKGETRSFPSMKRSRYKFGMTVMNQTLMIVGGWPTYDKMEKISMNGDEWVEEDLPFSVWGHCVVSINETTAMVIGGSDSDYNVS